MSPPSLAGKGDGGLGSAEPSHALTFQIVIPAHNEEAGLPRTLASVAALDYPPDLVRVLVVADNCTDFTAEVARAAGFACVARDDPARRGKGHALSFALRELPPDADVVLILDADCELNPAALRATAAVFAAGADAVQAAVRSGNVDAGPAGYVAAVGAAVDDAVAAGLDRLGFAAPLRGTGMAFRRELLEWVPWDAVGPVEDAEYAGRLRSVGVRPRYCAGAVVACEAPPVADELCRQRRRWRAAVSLRAWMASKPLVLLHLLVAVAAGIAVGFRVWPAVLVALTAAIYLRAAADVGITRHRLRLLLRAPALVLRLAGVTLAGFVRRPAAWDAAGRPA